MPAVRIDAPSDFPEGLCVFSRVFFAHGRITDGGPRVMLPAGPCPAGFAGDGTTCADIDDCVIPGTSDPSCDSAPPPSPHERSAPKPLLCLRFCIWPASRVAEFEQPNMPRSRLTARWVTVAGGPTGVCEDLGANAYRCTFSHAPTGRRLQVLLGVLGGPPLCCFMFCCFMFCCFMFCCFMLAHAAVNGLTAHSFAAAAAGGGRGGGALRGAAPAAAARRAAAAAASDPAPAAAAAAAAAGCCCCCCCYGGERAELCAPRRCFVRGGGSLCQLRGPRGCGR